MSTAKNAKFTGTIQSWGNSLGLRITQPVGQLMKLKKGSEVSIEVTNQGLVIKPIQSTRKIFPFSEAELIKGLTPAKAHADELPTPLSSELGA